MPSLLALMLSISPPWCALPPTLPCGEPAGLKCPPALLASAALQSPFSWMWMACTLLGAKPPISPVRCTPSRIGMTLSRPLTRLPEAEARLTTAALAVDAGIAADDDGALFVVGAELQAVTARAAAASNMVFVRVSL